jgi:hypothetical protein
MTKGYIVLNIKEVSTLCWCLMKTPCHSATEERQHIKLHEKLLKLQHQLELEDVNKKHRKERENG